MHKGQHTVWHRRHKLHPEGNPPLNVDWHLNSPNMLPNSLVLLRDVRIVDGGVFPPTNAAFRWRAPCKAGQKHTLVKRNGHVAELSATPKKRAYSWSCKRCGISAVLLHKLPCRFVQMGIPALFHNRPICASHGQALHKRSKGTLMDYFSPSVSSLNVPSRVRSLPHTCALSQAQPPLGTLSWVETAGGAPSPPTHTAPPPRRRL